jgi:hypothetical protein
VYDFLGGEYERSENREEHAQSRLAFDVSHFFSNVFCFFCLPDRVAGRFPSENINFLGDRMRGGLGIVILVSWLLVWSAAAFGQDSEVSKEQIKGLDEQVQEIKSDILAIAAELNQLEEKLLYPSDTQLAVFVSVPKGDNFRLDSVEIQLDGKAVATYLYNYKELEALQKGGVQRIYTGNVRTGEHEMQVTLAGRSQAGGDIRRVETFKITKGVGPKIVELALAGSRAGDHAITLKSW